MATTTSDLISASRTLDPASRALLNLWLHRGLDDLAIAHLSGGSVEEVADRRRRLVALLAEEMHTPAEEVRAVLDAMAGEPRASSDPQDEPERPVGNGVLASGLVLPRDPAPDAAAELLLPGSTDLAPPSAAPADLVVPGEADRPEEPAIVIPTAVDVETEDDHRRAAVVLPESLAAPAVPAELVVPDDATPAARRAAERDRDRDRDPGTRRRPVAATGSRSSPFPAALGFALGAVIVIMVGIAALSGGSGDSGGSGSANASETPSATATAPAAAIQAPPTALEPLLSGPAGIRGTVVTRGEHAVLRVEGLERPVADYEVWLFNTVADSQSLGRLSQRRFRLPAERNRYRYLEVSLEPPSDRIPAHSGRTVLRAPVPR